MVRLTIWFVLTAPLHYGQLFVIFFGVHLALDYDYMV